MTSHIFNLNTERKQRINQTGKWEHEKLAKISFKVFRHLDDAENMKASVSEV